MLDHDNGGLELRVLEEDGTERRHPIAVNSTANLMEDLAHALAGRARAPVEKA